MSRRVHEAGLDRRERRAHADVLAQVAPGAVGVAGRQVRVRQRCHRIRELVRPALRLGVGGRVVDQGPHAVARACRVDLVLHGLLVLADAADEQSGGEDAATDDGHGDAAQTRAAGGSVGERRNSWRESRPYRPIGTPRVRTLRSSCRVCPMTRPDGLGGRRPGMSPRVEARYTQRSPGGVAQLARALRSHRRGRGFDSHHLHQGRPTSESPATRGWTRHGCVLDEADDPVRSGIRPVARHAARR